MQKQDQDREASIPLQSMKSPEEGLDDFSPSDTLEIKLEPSRTFSTPAQAKKIDIPAWLIIPIWMACSVSVILYNKYIFTSLKFQYPIFLTTWHLVFSAIGTRVLQRTTTLLDSVKDIDMPRDKWMRTILPIGVLFSGSLILSNYAYLTLSVSFIQMLKAFNPVVILLISFAFRLQEPNQRLVGVVAMISFGCCTAAYGEVNFEMVGFVCQCLALCFEASRLVMIEILLHGMKMNPLVSLYYYAPVCAALNFVLMLLIEGVEPFYHLERVGAFVLITNAGVAFALNVAAVFLIAVGSGLILTLAGVLKDILLISGSVLAFGSSITIVQVFGYTVALAGLVLFKTGGAKK